jgi:hypothetical protein
MPKKNASKRIPTAFTEEQFNSFILPYLYIPKYGPKPKISYFKKFTYISKILTTGSQWHELVVDKDETGQPEIHYSNIHRTHLLWSGHGSYEEIFVNSVVTLKNNNLLDLEVIHGDGTTQSAKKGGDNLGFNGHKKIKGDKHIVFSDRNCNIVAPFLSVPGNRNECAAFESAFGKLKKSFKAFGISFHGSIMSLDGVYNSKANRKLIHNSQMTPNINLRKCDKERKGRNQKFDEKIFKERFHTIERAFAWEDKFKRLLMRFEYISHVFDSFKYLAYTFINLRHFS